MVDFDLGEPLPGMPNIQNYAFNLDTGVMNLVSATDEGEAAPIMFTATIIGTGDFVVSPSPSTNLKECDELGEIAAQRCENEKTITSLVFGRPRPLSHGRRAVSLSTRSCRGPNGDPRSVFDRSLSADVSLFGRSGGNTKD